jgi:hypothetical protein
MVNLEVVARLVPLRPGQAPSSIRHIREQHASKTLCSNACLPEDGWSLFPDLHPEDVDAIDRCQWCYEVVDDRKRKERQSWFANA